MRTLTRRGDTTGRVFRASLERGDREARSLMTADDRTAPALFRDWWQSRLTAGDPDALAHWRRGQARTIGPDPLAWAPQDWPTGLGTSPDLLAPQPAPHLQLNETEALTGWRFWSIDDDQLVPPYVYATAAPHQRPPAWSPGTNTVPTWLCPGAHTGGHPRPGCYCGIRAVQSLNVLSAYGRDPNNGGPSAVALVEVWGNVAGPALADDWEYTLRAQHARIVGPLHLAAHAADEADALADTYGVEVLVDTPEARSCCRRRRPGSGRAR